MGADQLSVATAFIGGVFSFLSPCVLPLVPGYLSLISGLTLDQLRAETERERVSRTVILNTMTFILGFSLVFISLGASATWIGRVLQSQMAVLSKIAGVVIILFGLHLAGILKINLLYREARFHSQPSQRGLLGAFVMGLAFAIGWTPCIGPILAAILALAAAQETVSQGVLLLTVYSLGLGIPFLLTGMGTNYFLLFYKNFKRHLRRVEMASGVLLVAIGVLIFTNNLAVLSRYLSFIPDLGPKAPAARAVSSEAKPAPDVTLSLLNGESMKLRDLQGRVVLLNFWATWCVPCIEEIPSLQKLSQAYADRGLVVVGAAVESEPEDIKKFVAKHQMTYPIALGDDRLQKAFPGVTGLPTTFILDKKGNIRKQLVGAADYRTFEEAIEELLNE